MKTILFIITILTLGCGPEYYVPNSQNIPIMKSKGQTNLGIGYNESDYTRGFEFQAAHAITNHFALLLNGDWVKNGKKGYLGDASEDLKAKGKMLEIGAGYFKDIARNFTFETYGLLAFGKIELENNKSGINNLSAKFNRVGIQPSLSYNRKHFTTSLSSRIVHLKYKDINANGNLEGFDPNYLKTNNAYWLLEPALTIQAGSENLKFQLQYVYSYNLTNPSFEQELDIISLGIKLKIDPKKQIKSLKK
ncbi:hypothetical protein [Flavobacterium undicola]|uniref:hypothetical protein n=1 Tax=Flavobacterium undicola TaxID=1932779 RepID=UPI00137788EA|nr:hypothetical protein [Flavobacterium undicola]MBA0883335.1 hypothetical protein [Flavobacterium undicola]